MLTKSGHFWTTYLPCLVNVVCERPLMLCLYVEVLVVGYRVQINRFGPTDYLRWEARSQTMAHYSNKAKMFKKFIKSGSKILKILEWRCYDTFFETSSHFSFTATVNKVLKKRAYNIVALVVLVVFLNNCHIQNNVPHMVVLSLTFWDTQSAL